MAPGRKRAAEQVGPAGAWLTTEEAAAYLGLSTRALYHRVERGEVPAHRGLRGRLRFRRDELDALVSGEP